ncbi:ribosome assembly cofactor RimP [Flavobacterium okayamense]|uniref:Ribosome maturation factor RimP n=1 Tax=Flavobacterium okayamense TaxID=2830782 RepID=A0ABM7S3L6_9FLAO|nr:ribosome assembly cofactor RimP [Flavobacterium okayamense]BCY28125.1 ribosome maturation factor RimP [Flavobacterium okayamense]
MNFKGRVEELLNEALNVRSDLFLIELKISDDRKILVTLDGDNGVNLQDCIDVSRAIEHNLDREEFDFALEVASAGAYSPMTLPRQYKKNIGRKVKVKTISGNVIEADITEASEENITLEWKAREPKKIGKGKETVEKKVVLPFEEIKEATVIISF